MVWVQFDNFLKVNQFGTLAIFKTIQCTIYFLFFKLLVHFRFHSVSAGNILTCQSLMVGKFLITVNP